MPMVRSEKLGALVIASMLFAFAVTIAFAYIDSSGRQITPFKFRDVTPFSEGMAAVSEGDRGPYGFIDKTGKYLIKPIYDYAKPFKEGKAQVGICPHPS